MTYSEGTQAPPGGLAPPLAHDIPINPANLLDRKPGRPVFAGWAIEAGLLA
jgi:hypothetical protein